MLRTKRLAVGVLAVGSALALAACNSSNSTGTSGSTGATTPAAAGHSTGGTQSVAAALAAAVTTSTNDGSVHISGTEQITGGPAGGGTTTLSGAEKFTPLAADLTESGPLFSQLSALGGGQAPSTVELIVSNAVIYAKVGAAMPMSGGKPWISIDPSKLPNSMGSIGAASQNVDPVQQMKLLVAAQGLADEGTETVDNTTTTHFHGTVPLAVALESQAANLTPQEREQLQQEIAASGFTTDTVDLWLDDQGRPVRETSAMSGGALTIHTDVHLSDWGTPVTVTPPPASQVFDLSSLLGSIPGGLPKA